MQLCYAKGMLGRTYDNQICSIARALEVVGERWSLLIIRDAFLGLKRFEEFQASLGVARNVLTQRLSRLVDEGILERVRYQERPTRYEYRLTSKGGELGTAVIALLQWGDRHLAGEAGPPRLVEHAVCSGNAVAQLVCDKCGNAIGPHEVELKPGPALREVAA
jgi:DNA-binding HxlR family transcriptional regulator